MRPCRPRVRAVMHRCMSAQGVEAIFARRKQEEDPDHGPTHVVAHAASKRVDAEAILPLFLFVT